ncbi:hypothetical protein [Galactobacter caseinivorans]|uniref:Uncharacterized protein n=1 Tax=Galactobacter caseinivorans TaxID=2676123 RepID=A0A496PH77_9MICC|nr:hypothetical protein [Galactobacter caseinivorans]RKW69836.1 hypothetical protein DWQ67_10150 [Galactobacter caseinivorans]
MSYTSHESLYRRRWIEGETLRVDHANMLTGDPTTPTTPGIALIARDHHILLCITTEHALQLHEQLTDALGESN